MAGDKVRLGIIGANAHYGWSNRAHFPALQALDDYELVAVCTAHKETAEESARHYGARLAFHDYNEMSRHPDIDLVAVSVRVPFHHAMVMAALEGGKHVFCEWPLGANLVEAEQMATLAKSRGVCNMVGLQARGDPTLLHIRELVRDGYVGEVLSCSMVSFRAGILQTGLERAWMADRDKGANTFSISGGHSIDALCMCVGEFREVSARVATQVPSWETSEPGKPVEVTSPDNILVSGVLASGAVASVHVAAVPWHGTGWRMEIYGREGTLIASSRETVQFGDIRLQGARKGTRVLEDLSVPERLTAIPSGVPRGEPSNVGQLYCRLAGAIRGQGEAQPDFELALKRHRLLDAIQRSSDQGKAVQVT